MTKLGMGRNWFLKIICTALLDSYGKSLTEGDTDLRMAETVFRRLRKYLDIGPADISNRDLQVWRSKAKQELGIDVGDAG
jgi:hypothetical protein